MGLVEILTAEENLIPLQTSLPEAIVTVYGTSFTRTCNKFRPACGQHCPRARYGTDPVALEVVKLYCGNVVRPAVVDADAQSVSQNRALKNTSAGKIITPHAGEMARLVGNRTADEIMNSVGETVRAFAKEKGLVCVLKDNRTAVSDGGKRVYVNNSGNNGMSTAGAGDVLAGIIGAILAQNRNEKNLTAFDCACLGVYIHGLAGDIALKKTGYYALMSRDIIDSISEVFR